MHRASDPARRPAWPTESRPHTQARRVVPDWCRARRRRPSLWEPIGRPGADRQCFDHARVAPLRLPLPPCTGSSFALLCGSQISSSSNWVQAPEQRGPANGGREGYCAAADRPVKLPPMTRTEPALRNARTPMTQALQAIAVIPLNPSTHGARNKRTPSINGRYSMVGFHRNSSDPAPKTKSKTPPTYAVQAAAVCEVSPKTNGVMKRTTPNSALIQSCQRISPDIAINLLVLLSLTT